MGVFLGEVRKGPVPISIFFNLFISDLKIKRLVERQIMIRAGWIQTSGKLDLLKYSTFWCTYLQSHMRKVRTVSQTLGIIF